MGQHHAQRAARQVIGGAEELAEHGLDAQQRQRRRAQQQSRHTFWIVTSRDRDCRGIPGANRLERRLILAICEIGRRAMIRSGPARGVMADAHQPLGLIERQGLQQHAVHDAEDRRRGADAERQRQNGRRGKRRLLPEGPGRVADVLPDIADEPHVDPRHEQPLLGQGILHERLEESRRPDLN